MPNRTRCRLTSILILSLTLFGVSKVYSQTFEERVDRYISSFPKYSEFRGVIFAAVGDKIYLNKGYGLASREYNISNGPDTKFQVGSITKAFTAILTLKMIEKGLIDLDATISDYLPYYPGKTGRKIKIRHLLAHSSGISHHYIAIPDYFNVEDNIFHTSRELVQLFQDVPLAHEPGARFTYSSPGYYILGAILEKVTNKSYAELLRENIFDPLGMKDTRVENNLTIQKNMATGYMRGLSGLVRAGFEDKSTALAAGDLVASAYDLYLWHRGMLADSGTILTAESKKLLYSPTFPNQIMTFGGPYMKIPYDDGQKTLEINRLSGSSTGYTCAMDRFFDPDACVIVLSNVQDTQAVRILDDISDFLLRNYLGIHIGHTAPPTLDSPPAAQVDEDDIRKILGFYKNSDSSITGIIRDGEELYQLSYTKGSFAQAAVELVPKSPDRYYLGPLTIMECQFTRDEEGLRTLAIWRNERSIATSRESEPFKTDVSKYEGYYTSVELQKTFHFSSTSNGLVGEDFLGDEISPLVPLEEDPFGFGHGFIEFLRYPDGTISGFKLITKEVDTFFGSRFVKR